MKYETYIRFRDRAGKTDHNIAEMTLIPKSTFSEWKRGRYTPKLEKQKLIAEKLNIPDSLLLEPDETRDERRELYDDGDHD